MKGIGGIWGNRGGVKKFPVCRVCEEIMDPNLETTPVTVMPVVSLSVNSLRVGIGLLVLALLLVGIFFGLEIWS